MAISKLATGWMEWMFPSQGAGAAPAAEPEGVAHGLGAAPPDLLQLPAMARTHTGHVGEATPAATPASVTGRRVLVQPQIRVADDHPVVVFLKGFGLERYAEVLIRNGFDDMDTLLEVDDADLKDFGFPRGHILKMRKRLKEFELGKVVPQQEKERKPPTSSAAFTPAAITPAAPTTAATPVKKSAPAPLKEVAPFQAPHRMISAEMKSAVERSWDQLQAFGTLMMADKLFKHFLRLSPATVQLFPTHVRSKYTDWTVNEADFQGAIEHSPAMRRLFSKVINALGCAVAGLHDVRKLVPMLMQLGERHAAYGVTEAHWRVLGEALNLALEDALQDAYTQEVSSAWMTVYRFISSIMKEGFRSAMAVRNELAMGKASGPCDDAVSTSVGSAVAMSTSASDLL